MIRIIEKLRERFAAGQIQLFLPPYLPDGLVGIALLLAFTDGMVILLGQPAAYWFNAGRAESEFPFLTSLLAQPWWYALALLLYLALIWGLLGLLTRSVALALWLPLSFAHLWHAMTWLSGRLSLEGSWLPLVVNVVSAALLGIFLAFALLKPKAGPKPWMKRFKILIPVLWILMLVGMVSVRAISPKGGWQQIKPAHNPGQRSNTTIAYDTARRKAVLFGGLSRWLGTTYYYNNDTWEWDGKDWTQIKPAHQPSLRADHMMAYDEKHGVVVLFGGKDKSGAYMLNDTWLWDGKDWTQAFPDSAPPPRRDAQMFYDKTSGEIILAGGYSGDPKTKDMQQYADTWAWDGKNWQYVSSEESWVIITNPVNGYDSTRNREVVFDYNGLLIWSNGVWTKTQPATQPPPRWGPVMAADPVSGKMLFFGGFDELGMKSDTWLLNGETWQQLHPDLSPEARDASSMFYDPVRKSFIVYGGVKVYALDDMWEYVLP